MLDFYMLGTSGTYPLINRALSSCVVKMCGKTFLFDCGEGTQTQFQKHPVTAHDIDYIFISHMHADHLSGLYGLLISMKEAQRTSPLTIVGPKRIKAFVQGMFSAANVKCVPVNFIEIEPGSELCMLDGPIKIDSCVADHNMLCYAYSIEAQRLPEFLHGKAQKECIPVKFWSLLAKGHNIEYNGKIYRHQDFWGPKRKGMKFCYITDTRPTEKLRDFVKDSNLAVIEGMYKDDSKIVDAMEKKHMLWNEAASLISGNNVSKAILTHYSPSMRINREEDQKLASSMSPNLIVGYDGLEMIVNYN